jgi:Arc/MetJ-type ribon-helix-helix transcriptional regulator
MSNIQLPNTLVDQIAAAGVPVASVDEFVQQAVREKLHEEERRKEFHRLTAKIREAMLAKGLTEDELLADFKKQRRPETSQTVDDFDTLCDEAAVSAPETHLTRSIART